MTHFSLYRLHIKHKTTTSLAVIAVLIFIATAFPVLARGQVKTRNFYPTFNDLKGLPNQNVLGIDTAGCISGDCKDGEGVFINLKQWGFISATNDKLPMEMLVFKGKFSQGGNSFNGKIFRIEMDLQREGDVKEGFRYVPLKPVPDFSSGENVDLYLVAEGDALAITNWAKLVQEYVLHGRATDFYTANMKKDSVISRTGIYNYGNALWASINYHPSTGRKSFEGFTQFNGSPLAGKMVYTDGSVYQGALFAAKHHGPGVWTKGNAKKSGSWVLGSLIEELPIALPTGGFNIPDTNNLIGYQLKGQNLEATALQGQGAAGWYWRKDNLFYGKLAEGKPEGFCYSFQVTENKTLRNNYHWYNWSCGVAEGIFTAGIQQTGSTGYERLRFRHPLQSSARVLPEAYHVENALVTEGKFEKDKLQGCATIHAIRPKQETYIKHFVDGIEKGWMARVKPNGEPLAVYYTTWPAQGGIRALIDEAELTEADLTAVKKQPFTCMKVPDSLINRYLADVRKTMEIRAETTRWMERDRIEREKQAKLDAANSPCGIGKQLLDKVGGRIATSGNWQTILLNYDCNTGKYLVAKRTRPGKVDELVQQEVVWTSEFDHAATFSSERYTLCSACGGEGGYDKAQRTTTETWKPVLGLVVYQRVYRTKTTVRKAPCTACRGHAWIRTSVW